MRHIPDGTLRRLVDEPLAVADSDVAHLARCAYCSAHRDQIAADAMASARLLVRPQAVPDFDGAWQRLTTAVSSGVAQPTPLERPRFRSRRHPIWRIFALPAPSAAAVASLGALAGAVAAVIALTVLVRPAPAPSQNASPDVQDVAYVFGLGGSRVVGGFASPSGSLHLAFGWLRWHSAGRPFEVSSIAAARRVTGLPVGTVSQLPAGVGAPSSIVVQPRVTATITFDSRAGAPLAGTSFTVTGGPAVLVEYGVKDASFGRFPALATVVMDRPVSTTSTGVPKSQLTAFLLSRPGIPTPLAQEIRMLGGGGILAMAPIPGSGVSQVDIGGSPGVLVTEGGGAASGVVWEDGHGVVHAALGLLDQEDILNVANQIG